MSMETISSTGTGYLCPKCGKPYIYVGDPVDNLSDLICQCYREEPTTYSYPMGWVCPKCGRSLSPYTMVCPCHTPTITYGNTTKTWGEK